MRRNIAINPKTAAPGPRPLSIGALSRATRIPAETLRTWERRYGSPAPVRKPSGHRIYEAATVDRLRRVARLLRQGHRPADLLPLSVNELDSLLALSQGPGAGAAAPGPGVPAAAATTPPLEAGAIERSLEEMLHAAASLDREPLMRELRANWVRLGPVRFLDGCTGEFLVRIGAAWHDEALEVRHEHFASACVADFLRDVREPYDEAARGARVIVAAPPGELHEGGLLMVSLLLALRDFRVVYLGANTPVEEIAAAARAEGVEVVTISLSSAIPRSRGAKIVERLREAMPHRVSLWVGGAGAPPARKGVECFDSLSALDARVAARS